MLNMELSSETSVSNKQISKLLGEKTAIKIIVAVKT